MSLSLSLKVFLKNELKYFEIILIEEGVLLFGIFFHFEMGYLFFVCFN